MPKDPPEKSHQRTSLNHLPEALFALLHHM